jgi:hypothetical protein
MKLSRTTLFGMPSPRIDRRTVLTAGASAGLAAAAPAQKSGAALLVEALGMPHRWYSFDEAGWHFVVLDSMADYGALSQEQLDWLRADLAATPRDLPVCVLSHLPIVSVTSLIYGDDCRRPGGIDVPTTWQHADGRFDYRFVDYGWPVRQWSGKQLPPV